MVSSSPSICAMFDTNRLSKMTDSARQQRSMEVLRMNKKRKKGGMKRRIMKKDEEQEEQEEQL